LHYLIDCLKKTPPPVVIFSEHQNDVDDIHEYLLIKGVEVVGLHGAKRKTIYLIINLAQDERSLALKLFITE
jgi:ATP-dependent RNA helicase DDX41